jgi:hypothetical protein
MSGQVDLEAIDNREDWDDVIDVFDDREPFDLTDCTEMTLTVWDSKCPTRSVLSGTLDDALAIEDAANGVVSIHFDKSELGRLLAKEYNWSLRAVIGGATRTLILGTLPVLDGGP